MEAACDIVVSGSQKILVYLESDSEYLNQYFVFAICVFVLCWRHEWGCPNYINHLLGWNKRTNQIRRKFQENQNNILTS